MSYDLAIRSDESYSRSVPRDALMAFVLALPAVQTNGRIGCVLDDPPHRWMEIDLETVDDEGDWIEDDEGEDDGQVNKIHFHIPYGMLRAESFERDYLEVALAIAKHVGWPLWDLQTEQIWSPA